MKTRDKILLVAEEEFSKLGYDALSMNELVKKLDINKATVYYHFKDKRALYHAILADVLNELNEEIEKSFDDSLNGEELFKEYIQVYIQRIKQRPTIVPLVLREMANFGSNTDDNIITLFDKMIDGIEQVSKKLDLKDKYKDINAYSLHTLICGTIDSFYVIQMSKLPIGINENGLKGDAQKSMDFIGEFITNIVLDAICKK